MTLLDRDQVGERGVLSTAETQNRLLARCPRDTLERLRAHLALLDMPKGEEIAQADGPIEWAYFPESGVGSIVSVSPEGQEVEAGLFGREGFSPTSLILGGLRSPNRIIFQVAGSAWRIERKALLDVVAADPAFRELLLRYVETLMIQVQHTALSNAVHPVDQRLARWLLMCDDRCDGAELRLTHEFMAVMLAVRRSTVTTTLHVLEGQGFIRAHRGTVVIRDRPGLEAFAGAAYGRPEAAYRELVGAD